MPSSPSFRCSPRRELKGEKQKRGNSLEIPLSYREKDDDLALFNEMQSNRSESFLFHSADDFEDAFSTKLRHFSNLKLGMSVPARGESRDLLNIDGERNDYDWLLTPPDTPLFTSLDDEMPPVNLVTRGRPRSQRISFSRSSTMEKSYKSSRSSASPQRMSPSSRSSISPSHCRGRASFTTQSSPTSSIRQMAVSHRSSPSPSIQPTPATRSSTPTSHRISTGSKSAAVLSGVRGSSPLKANRGNSSSTLNACRGKSNIPGFSSDVPPNLRTSLDDRPTSYIRGSPLTSRNGRNSISPTPCRSTGASYNLDRDRFSSNSKGYVVSSADDDMDFLQSIPLSCDELGSKRVSASQKNRAPAFSKKPLRLLSPGSTPKKSIDSSIRHLAHPRSPQNRFRPLLSSVPSTTLYTGKIPSAHLAMISRNSSVTSSSNASSDRSTSMLHDIERSDQNHNVMTSEYWNVLSHKIHDKAFVLEEISTVNENAGQESLFIDSENPYQISEAVYKITHNSKADNFEDAICSKCDCTYRSIEPLEKNGNLCLDCNSKGEPIIMTMTTMVNESLADLSTNGLKESKHAGESEPFKALSDYPEITELENIHYEESVKQDQTDGLVQNESYLERNIIAEPSKDKYELVHVDSKQMSQPNAECTHVKHHLNADVDVSMATGFSVLVLTRSNSCNGHVFQERACTSFTAPHRDSSRVSDDTSSYAGFINASASSVDLSSSRQPSGSKSETENSRHDTNTKSESTGSVFSEISNIVYAGSSLARSVHEENFVTYVENNEEIPVASQKKSEHMDVDEENGSCQVINGLNSELSSHTLNGWLKASCANDNEFISNNGKEFSKNVETSAISRESSNMEEHILLNDPSLGSEIAEAHSKRSLGIISEIEIESGHNNFHGSQTDVVSTNFESVVDVFQEPSLVLYSSDSDLTAFVLEGPTSSDYAHRISEELTVLVDHGGRKGRILTLEEATDGILFCSSIIHNLAYQAATIAIDNEKSIPFEPSHSTLAILGKSGSVKKSLRIKGSLKSQKSSKKQAETDVTENISTEMENDENACDTGKLLTQDVEIPVKVDSMMKPLRLESKCNCSIM